MNHFRYNYPALPIEEETNEGTRYGIKYLDGHPYGEHFGAYIQYYKSKKERDFILSAYLDERANDGSMCLICGEHFFGDECPYMGEHTQEEIDYALNNIGSLTDRKGEMPDE